MSPKNDLITIHVIEQASDTCTFVKVRLSQPIQILQELFEYPYQFYHNATILEINERFGFYNFKNEDKIFAIPRAHYFDCGSCIVDKFLEDQNSMGRVEQRAVNGAFKEYCKLKDLQMTRFERKPSLFRKISMYCGYTGCESSDSPNNYVNADNKNEMSQYLPQIW